MKVFLGWSGDRSYETAQAFYDWLPKVIQAVDPFISSGIPKGKRWGEALAEELEETRVGILCLTRDNLDSRWILFEAGALSKTKDAHVCTFLLDIKATDVEEPLASFQYTTFNKKDIQKLLNTINNAVNDSSERALSESGLDDVFKMWWPKLETKLNKIIESESAKSEVVREDRELLEEILDIVRELKDKKQELGGARIKARSFTPSNVPRELKEDYIAGEELLGTTSGSIPLLFNIIRGLQVAEETRKKDTDTSLEK